MPHVTTDLLAFRKRRQRLKAAARYARAGLAVAPPFAPKVSLGENSLREVLTRVGVQVER